jgi:uncharacterized membrane protein HdeD (DUF308 family)
MADPAANPDFCVMFGKGLFPWWLMLLWGILTLIIGVMFLRTPVLTTVLLITLMGAFWLVGGLFSLGSLVVDRTSMGLKIFLAVINILAGALILLYPFFSTLFILGFFVIFVGFFACFIGCSHLYTAFKNKDTGNGVLGLISLIFGILLLVYPLLTVELLPFIAGGFCIVFGILAIFSSFMAKNVQDVAKA